MKKNNQQFSDSILMIEPVSFGFNEQTAGDNYFQNRDYSAGINIQKDALKEFKNLVEKLTVKGIQVIVVKDTPEPHTPDSIFPNNWVSFHEDGRVVLYPMLAENRRAERRNDLIGLLKDKGYVITDLLDYSYYEKEGHFLEGTGSMVLDHINMIGYAALSKRTDKNLFEEFCTEFGYKSVSFIANQTFNGNRVPVYHTNVMICIGDRYAVVCMETIDNHEDRKKMERSLVESGKELIDISETQMHRFAANMLQVKGINSLPYLVMSQTALDSFSHTQLEKLKSYNSIITAQIPTIEKYGGGGVRCMMAEIFCPRTGGA